MSYLVSKVEVISETIQVFDGVRYYLCGSYFQNSHKSGERRLHRAVWVHHNGDIPDDCHIHHKDHNIHNNDIDNLECVSAFEHLSYHGDCADKERQIESMNYARVFASEWHGSPEGIEWHKKQYQLTKDKLLAMSEYACTQCGAEFESIKRDKGTGNRFCSRNCKAAWRRESGIDDEPRDCEYCKQEFMCNKYQKTKYCSSDCKKSAMREAREKAKA